MSLYFFWSDRRLTSERLKRNYLISEKTHRKYQKSSFEFVLSLFKGGDLFLFILTRNWKLTWNQHLLRFAWRRRGEFCNQCNFFHFKIQFIVNNLQRPCCSCCNLALRLGLGLNKLGLWHCFVQIRSAGYGGLGPWSQVGVHHSSPWVLPDEPSWVQMHGSGQSHLKRSVGTHLSFFLQLIIIREKSWRLKPEPRQSSD